MVFASGGSQVVPPLPPPPPPFQNVMGAIFLFVVAMIIWATADIVATFLRDLDVLARQPHDPRVVYRFAQYIFRTFGMGTRQINSIGNATIASQRISKASSKQSKVRGAL
jgi:peptidoglycan biosynthesis protein MviN/MurJ (putative lipid II flippase)